MTDSTENLEVFDRRNRLIGQASRGSLHRYGLRHRAVHILVFDLEGRLFLQFRAGQKDQYPRHWDTSAAGHVSPCESYPAAAARELAEELGIQADLSWVLGVAAGADTGWEHIGLFCCQTALEPRLDPGEIETGRFFSATELEKLLSDPAMAVTPAFRLLYRLWQGHAGGGR